VQSVSRCAATTRCAANTKDTKDTKGQPCNVSWFGLYLLVQPL
jgi:hypothetical protein